MSRGQVAKRSVARYYSRLVALQLVTASEAVRAGMSQADAVTHCLNTGCKHAASMNTLCVSLSD